MDVLFQSRFNGLSTVQIQMVQPPILKSHKRSKMIETHFYRLYSIMSGSNIIASSPSEKWHLILKLLTEFYCKFVVLFAWGMPYPCIFVEEAVPLLGAVTDKLVITSVCGRN